MKAYVINLARRPDRLAAMTCQFALLGISFRLVEAVDACRISKTCLSRHFVSDGPLGEISAGDMACTLSHLKALKQFLQSGEPYGLILEDDVYISADASRWLTTSTWIPSGIDLVKLERFGPRWQSIVTAAEMHVGDRTLAKLLSKHCGAAAYVVSRRAARRVLQLAEAPLSLPIDHVLFNVNNSPLKGELTAWQLKPALCEQQHAVGGPTDISLWRRAECPRGFRYLQRELVRAYYEVRLLPVQIAMILRRRASIGLIAFR